jgi:transposase InsO family protein
MSWKQTCVMSERIKLINDYLSGDFGISELSVQYEVSRKTAYKWISRYESGGWAGLEDQSRAPRHHANTVAAEIERELLELKARRPLWGAPKLRRKLLEAVGVSRCPAESTVSEILRRHGLSGVCKRRRRAVPSQSPLGHCQEANAVWSADFKGWFRTGDGSKCTPLTISDGRSRYLLRCQGLGGETGWVTVQPLFIATFREYGMPAALRTDNGTPFATTGLGGLSALAVWWVRLGIGLQRIEPGQPQQNGRHERMHRTLKEATATPPRATLRAQQKAFDEFRREYNEERPHEALGQRPPASCYEASVREYPERLPEQRGYPDEWEKRVVRKGGQMKWKGRDIRLTSALWGQEVGLKPVGEREWAVYFEGLELGIFEEDQGRVRPVKRLRSPCQDQDNVLLEKGSEGRPRE